MSARLRRSNAAQHHVEWLQLVDVSGPFVSLGVLAEAFPLGLDAVDPELADRLKQAHVEWQANRDLRRPDAAIDTLFVDFMLGEVLEYPDTLSATGAEIGDAYTAALPEHRVTLRPDRAIRRLGEPPKLLVSIYPPDVALGKPLDERGLHASPAERMRILLSRTGVRSGLVANGREWVFVHAPADRTASFVTWYANLLVEERVTLRAFRSLLGVRRLFGVDDPETLNGLFERSRDDEREVTDQLGVQARRAVELLVAAFDRADRESGGKIAEGIRKLERNEEAPSTLYEAVLVVVMRIVFLLAAEARGLFPDDGPWADSYALTPVRSGLEAQADRHGIEVLERRYDAWPRLIATFRAVHDGVEHSRVRMPGYGGGLFDPTRYPFLEGGAGPLPRVSNRVVLHVLDALQTLEVDVAGGRERRPLSFRALGIEQIGHVYEGLLDHTAVRADAPALGLSGTKKKEPEIALALLEEARDKGKDGLLDVGIEETGRSRSALRKALDSEPSVDRVARLRRVCNHDAELVERVLPFLGLVRDSVFGDPMVFREGHVYVTESTLRQSTGTHYTPPSLTEPIVQYALEPIVYRGPAEGTPREQWELKRPAELLELKVCDIAMGSAAFLAAACRYLAARLVEAWELHPHEAPPDAGVDLDEKELTARRLVAERCLYGVDINPLAVEIAKVSLWLTTLRRDRPFTFVDHALGCGDSLLGLTSVDEFEALTLKPDEAESILLEPARVAVRSTVDDIRSLREKIEASDAIEIQDTNQKASALVRAERKLHALRIVGDLVVGASLDKAAAGGKPRLILDAAAEEISIALAVSDDDHRDALLAHVEAHTRDVLMGGRAPGSPHPPQPFHWSLEFPEVFQRENGGFDAIVGNPPFLGGVRLSEQLGSVYRNYLAEFVAAGHANRNTDLVAYFVLRAIGVLRPGGTSGLITTNSISQGHTADAALGPLVRDARVVIFRATKSRDWPGEAALYISEVWCICRGWSGEIVLDGVQVPRIGARLDSASRVSGEPYDLATNRGMVSNGVKVNGPFPMSNELAMQLIAEDPSSAPVIKPYVVAKDLADSPDMFPSRHAVDFRGFDVDRARRHTAAWKYIEDVVLPFRLTLVKKPRLRERYWDYEVKQDEMERRLANNKRVLVGPQVAKWWFVAWLPNGWLFSHMVNIFAFEDDCHAAVLSSAFHEAWARKYSGSLKFDLRYSPTDCFQNFPFPGQLPVLKEIGARYLTDRNETLLAERQGLTRIYNRINEQPGDLSEAIERLRRLRRELDREVADAYGWTDLELDHDFRDTPLGLRYTISEAVKTEALDRLLELNHARYDEEVAQGLHAKSAKRVGRSTRKGAAESSAGRLFGT